MAWSASVKAIERGERGISPVVRVVYIDGTGKMVESDITLIGQTPLVDLKNRIREEIKRLTAIDALEGVLSPGPIDVTLPPAPVQEDPTQGELDQRAFQTAYQTLQAALRGVAAGIWSRTDPIVVALADDAKAKFKKEYTRLL